MDGSLDDAAAAATGLLAEGGVSLPTDQGTDGTIPSEGFQQEGLSGVSSSSSSEGSAVAVAQDKKGSPAVGGVVAALEAAREVVSENKATLTLTLTRAVVLILAAAAVHSSGSFEPVRRPVTCAKNASEPDDVPFVTYK